MKTDLQKGIDTLSTKEDRRNILPSRKSQNYIALSEPNTEETLNSYSSNNPILTIPTPTIDNTRINSIELKKIEKSSKEENTSIKSHPQQDSDKNTPSVEKKSKFASSSVTVSTMQKSPIMPKTIKGNESNKLTILHHEENEVLISSPKIHAFRLTKNKVSASFITGANTHSEPDVSRIRSQSDANNFNNNNITVTHISNQNLGHGSSNNIIKQQENQTSSAHTDQSIITKLKNVRNNLVGHDDDDIQTRATSLGGISVSYIKIADNKGKPFVDDGISVSNVKIADNKGKSFVDAGASVSNIRIANSRGQSFVDAGASVSNIRIANSRGQSFVDAGASVSNIRIANSRGKSFVDAGASVSNIRIANSRGKSFVDAGASVSNIRIGNSRGKSFVDAGASVSNIKVAGIKKGKSFVDHPTNSIVLNEEIKPRTDHQVAVDSVKKEHS